MKKLGLLFAIVTTVQIHTVNFRNFWKSSLADRIHTATQDPDLSPFAFGHTSTDSTGRPSLNKMEENLRGPLEPDANSMINLHLYNAQRTKQELERLNDYIKQTSKNKKIKTEEDEYQYHRAKKELKFLPLVQEYHEAMAQRYKDALLAPKTHSIEWDEIMEYKKEPKSNNINDELVKIEHNPKNNPSTEWTNSMYQKAFQRRINEANNFRRSGSTELFTDSRPEFSSSDEF